MGLYQKIAAAEADSMMLLERLWSRVSSGNREDQLITSIMKMAHNAINASASSFLIVDERNQRLYFKYASGPVGGDLKRLHISRQSGIAGWIARNGKPLLVNDPKRNTVFYRQIDSATGFKTKNIIGVPVVMDKRVIGVIEALNKENGKDFTRDDLKILQGVAQTAAISLEMARANAELLVSYKSTVAAIVSLADAKEITGNGHSERVARYAVCGAKELSLPFKQWQDIEYAGLFHDIGKLLVPERILNKAEELTGEEWARIRKHPLTGYKLLKDVPIMKEASKLILHHHERYDGTGYPEGLKGEDIPIGARLLAVADALDYMMTGHAHREALSQSKAFAELYQNARTQFCPAAVKAISVGLSRDKTAAGSSEKSPRKRS